MEKRQYERYQLDDTVILNPLGVCQLRDLSSGGLSFKCLCGHDYPQEWNIDILDTTGSHLESVKVEKVWESFENDTAESSTFALAVGVKFRTLSPEQQFALHEMITRAAQ